MIMLITLCYIACVYVAFKVIKIKLTSISIAIAVLIGVFILGGIVIGWKFTAPMTQRMTVTRPVIPLLSSQGSKDTIKKIHVKREQPVKKGDLLYETDTTTLQNTLDQRTSQFAEAESKVEAAEADVVAAKSRLDQAKASRAQAKSDYDISSGMQKDDAGAVSELAVDVDKFTYDSTKAAVDVAITNQTTAEFALEVTRKSLQVKEAQLRLAKLELDRAFIRAPADGHVMNWQASEGTMTTTVITSAQGTFVDMTQTRIVAVLRQNLLKNVAPGDEVEIAFKSFPNRIIKAKVDTVLEFTGEGQLLTSGVLSVAANIGSKGFLAVRINLDDDAFAKELPLGGAGTTAIYTQFGKPFHLITKIALRMKSWLYNLPV